MNRWATVAPSLRDATPAELTSNTMRRAPTKQSATSAVGSQEPERLRTNGHPVDPMRSIPRMLIADLSENLLRVTYPLACSPGEDPREGGGRRAGADGRAAGGVVSGGGRGTGGREDRGA